MNSVIKDEINDKIYTIRGKQVMLDRDLAELYGVETRVLKQAVNRKRNRFPEDFMFILNDFEINHMVSQNVIPSKKYFGGSFPYVFTEQGVSNLSTVLKSEKAININIRIMRAFVSMRHFLIENKGIFQKLQQVDQKLIEHDDNFNKIFKAIESKQLTPNQGIFFDGQIYDAFKFVVDLIKSAENEIVLIDNYIDESVLTLLSNKSKDLNVVIYTANVSEKLLLAKEKFNKQYGNLEIKEFNKSHDRFLIVDSVTYHIGASLKDLGKKWFAFSRMKINVLNKIV